jgi:drug/metabolite transporter (DMT)-like permease
LSWRGWAAFAALGIIWGLPYFFIKVAVQEVPPFVIAFCRIALAALILLPIAARRGALRGIGRHKWALIAFALVEFAIPFSLITIGERWIASSVTGILIAMVPMSTALIQPLFGIREQLGAVRIAGMILGFLGVATLVGAGPIHGPLAWLGVGCMLVATLGYAVGPLIIQRHMSDIDSSGALAASLAVAAAALVVPALSQWPAQMPSSASIASIVLLGVLCTSVAMLLMFYLVHHAGATRATLITYINPVVATLLGVSLLHENLGVSGLIAFGMILLGCWLATRGRRPAHA